MHITDIGGGGEEEENQLLVHTVVGERLKIVDTNDVRGHTIVNTATRLLIPIIYVCVRGTGERGLIS